MNKSISDSDLHLTVQKDKLSPPSYVHSRNKRRREAEMEDFSDFKQEMRNMISELFSMQEKELKNISSTQREIQLTNQNIEKSVAFLSAQNEELKKKMVLLEEQNKEDKRQIAFLEDKVEELQKEKRKTNFIIKNVPKRKNEVKEDLIEMVTCLSKSIGCSMDNTDINDIYRVNGKNKEAQTTQLVVETSSTLLKVDLLKMCKVFNTKNKSKLCAKHLGFRTNEETPIFVMEHLTAKASRLHFLARDIAKSKNYKYCWTSYGRVYLRKDDISPIVTLKYESQAQQLLQEI